MISKEEFKKMLDTVMDQSGQTQEELALAMGYGKNYISEVMTPTGQITAKFLNAFRFKFAQHLENPNVVGDANAEYTGRPIQKPAQESDDTLKRILLILSESYKDLTSSHAKVISTNEELVLILKSNLIGSAATSGLSEQRNAPTPGHEEHREDFLGKQEIRSESKKKVYKKDKQD